MTFRYMRLADKASKTLFNRIKIFNKKNLFKKSHLYALEVLAACHLSLYKCLLLLFQTNGFLVPPIDVLFNFSNVLYIAAVIYYGLAGVRFNGLDRKRNLTTSLDRKNKYTARMLANVRKNHSIPLIYTYPTAQQSIEPPC